ncbi:hypothetical protein R3P38DRAFT_2790628 [Favolaschia claudopus]|uniref:Uncharacterized protein n=1 Tax=Favolaschia claudopus TaxID=2862362 RepID=A0AAW0AH71_9AGAR
MLSARPHSSDEQGDEYLVAVRRKHFVLHRVQLTIVCWLKDSRRLIRLRLRHQSPSGEPQTRHRHTHIYSLGAFIGKVVGAKKVALVGQSSGAVMIRIPGRTILSNTLRNIEFVVAVANCVYSLFSSDQSLSDSTSLSSLTMPIVGNIAVCSSWPSYGLVDARRDGGEGGSRGNG